ncbi:MULTISPECIES: EF0163 family protein [unclassified Enterococcus]|uniref:EF0163 family protein n=1 Tax=unclassified Enterococcus TaxID=2608891 RepID=UPI001553A83C|nr:MULTISPECIES: EF0163 family protein [unclassified Enterococcus]MBS7576974.1 hypothetical protein [Enterococcus sp. MMGLQ5-2]MBS7584381.1 hypothetical protein [Enterococcus sp. MMGLQ5-1]NPD12236.1 hypothetical protein [Enterococcus sp. MMGLQ5-1]NPD36808.1 hypothetical protein [Enterococcus sp. MMGLQ5-2]
MKKIEIVCFSLISLFILSACQFNQSKTTNKKSESEIVMNKVTDSSSTMTSKKQSQQETNQDTEKAETTDVLKLLKQFGSAYANYSGIKDRNEQLLELMTKDCALANGIYVEEDMGNMLSSRGTIENIYQPIDSKNSNAYAIQLNCEQNGSSLKVLLLVEVKDNKISSMTYNTLKQEY